MFEFIANLTRDKPDHPMLQNLDPDDNFFNEIYNGLKAGNISKYYNINNFNTTFKDESPYINITVFNIRSFKKNIYVLISLLASFHSLPEVVVLTETWGVEGGRVPCYWRVMIPYIPLGPIEGLVVYPFMLTHACS